MIETETHRQNGGVTWGLKTPTQHAQISS